MMLLSRNAINLSLILMPLFGLCQVEKELSKIEALQREIANEIGLKTVFRDQEAESLMYDFWEDSDQMIMIGSRYLPRFKWVNKSTCDYLGYSKSELVSVEFFDLIHPDDMAKSEKAFSRFQDTGAIGFDGDYFVNRYKHKNGTYLPMYWSNVIVNDKDYFLMQASKKKPR